MRKCMLALLVMAIATTMTALGANEDPIQRRATTRPAPVAPASNPAPNENALKARQIAALNRRVIADLLAGRYADAKDGLEQVLKIDPNNETALYNMGCAYSRLGEPQTALKYLEAAVESGYCDFCHLERDDDLASLRDVDAYKALLARREEVQRLRAQRILESLQGQFGQDYTCEIDHADKLVIATNIDRPTLSDVKARLTAQAEAVWRDLFSHPLEQYVTILIPRTESDKIPGVGGWYRHDQHLLVSKTIGMPLTHEFTHALHAADMEAIGQTHPIWVCEGFATLYETSQVKDGHITPLPNYRLNALKTLAARKQTIPWADFVKISQEQYISQAPIAYSQGRYMMMYLFDKGLLKKWYDAYTASYDKDPTGAKAIEQVFGKNLALVEADWLTWLAQQKALPVALPANHAYLGLRVEPETDGLTIAEIIGGSGAEKADLKKGDLIVKIDEQEMLDPGDLILMVDTHKVGDKLSVHFRRNGDYMTAAVTLQALPSTRAPAAAPAPAATDGATQQVVPQRSAKGNRQPRQQPAPVRQAA